VGVKTGAESCAVPPTSVEMSSISADEINFLVYRYLQESGFVHSAFTFAYESLVGQTGPAAANLPPGALISFIQKGMQYANLEDMLEVDGKQKPHAEAALKAMANAQTWAQKQGRKRTSDGEIIEAKSGRNRGKAERLIVSPENISTLKGHSAEVLACVWSPTEDFLASASADCTTCVWRFPPMCCGSEAAGLAMRGLLKLTHDRSSAATQSSKQNGDSSSSVADGGDTVSKKRKAAGDDAMNGVASRHEESVTVVTWSPGGKHIATATSAGRVCVWVANDGSCSCDFEDHKGPIFSLKWSPDGKYLASASYDHTAIVWNVAQASLQQQFAFHSQPVLDCDWRDSESFATCSVDKCIYYCKLGQDTPVHAFKGHQDEVNGVKWDSSEGGKYLASCSDDGTATIWNLEASTREVASFIKLVDENCTKMGASHDGEIHSIRWRTGGNCSVEGNDAKRKKRPLLLATASFDQTIKLWDGEMGSFLYELQENSGPVYTLAFSPDGNLLASGGVNGLLRIWNSSDGELRQTYQGDGDIFEVSWSSSGTKIAACFSNSLVCVTDVSL